MTTYSAKYIYRLKDKMTPAMKKIRRQSETMKKALKKHAHVIANTMNRTGKAVSEVGQKMTFAGAGISAGLGVMTKHAMDFRKGIAEISTLTKDTFDEVDKRMGGMLLGISAKYGQKTKVITKSAYQAISAGLEPSKKVVRNFLEVAGQAATGGVATMQEAVDGITNAINAYGPSVLSAKKASDLMFTAIKGGKTTFRELSSRMFNVIPTAAAVGVSFEEVTAGLAAITKQGTPTAQATTQMRQMIVELSKSSMEASKVFKRITGKTFADFVKEGGSIQEALKMINKFAKENNASMMDMFGSVEAGNAALQLSGKNANKFASALKEAKSSAGATQKAFDKMKKSADFKFRQAVATIKTLSIKLGKTLLPVVAKIAEKIEKNAKPLMNWIENNKTLVRKIILTTAAIAGFMVVAGPMLMIIGKVMQSVYFLHKGFGVIIKAGPVLAKMFGMIGVAVKGLVSLIAKSATFLVTNPIGWIILGVAAVATAVYLIWKNWNVVKNYVVGAIKTVMSFIWKWRGIIMTLFPVFIPLFAIWSKIKKKFGSITAFLKYTWAMMKQYWKWLAGVFMETISRIGTAYAKAFEIAKNVWSEIWEIAKGYYLTIWEIIKTATGPLTKAMKAINNVVGSLFPGNEKSIAVKKTMNVTGKQQSKMSVEKLRANEAKRREKQKTNVSVQNDVGGLLKIQIDQNGKAKVKENRPQGNLGFQVEEGA